MPAAVEGRRIHFEGVVQGVGFRPWVFRTAQRTGVTGRVRNDASGVTIEAFGAGDRLAEFLDALHDPPPAAHVDRVHLHAIEPEAAAAFEIVESDPSVERRVSIPPDLATCDQCLEEIFDRNNRRYRYPFTNCTSCGPRFTIATGIPYDRPATTMAPFVMCPECQREYDDPSDRRFHAQPNACPVCGPRLTLHTADGTLVHVDDAIAVAARAIADGLIVAVKGIGGFHLACDAKNPVAVAALRERKRRYEKPLAVMVRTPRDASALGFVGPEERRLLTSSERPIVLLQRRAGAKLADAVAPGNSMVGVFLPYSPLHHLLLADVRRPLVMTSGNASDEPMVTEASEAFEQLAGIADLFLVHDRPIQTRCDDSVAAVIGGKGTLIRRARGYVPRAIDIAARFERPVLACGALLKNTFCIGAGTSAWLGPHIGDLEDVSTFHAYTHAIELMEKFLDVRPRIVAHDLHPDYVSSDYARHRTDATCIAVQHHHAHVVSAMAEHGIEGPAIGIAYDGTGLGTDGTLWGGEVLVATASSFRRAATFRPLPMVGGDKAVVEPWRLALAMALDAHDGALPKNLPPLFTHVGVKEFEQVRALLARGTDLPLARGIGRYFDAFGALFLRRSRSTFEGQIALEWNQAADASTGRTYPYDIARAGEWDEVDLRRAVRMALADYKRGERIGAIAAAFHDTLAEATAEVVRRALARFGSLPIVGSGGCFQNARLVEAIAQALGPSEKLWLHEKVPPGDGGIALGQAVVANAKVRS